MQITPFLLHFIQMRTSICLFFSCHTATGKNNEKTEAMTPESALQPQTDQQADTKGQEHTTPKLVLSAHKKHPLHDCMQEVLYI